MAPLGTDKLLLVEARVTQEKRSAGIAYLLFFLFGPLGVQSLYLQRLALAATEALLTVAGTCLVATNHVYLGVFALVFLALFLVYDLWTINDCVREHAEAIRQALVSQMKAGASMRVAPAYQDQSSQCDSERVRRNRKEEVGTT